MEMPSVMSLQNSIHTLNCKMLFSSIWGAKFSYVFTLSVAEIPTGMIYADHMQKQHLQIQQTMQFESI